MVGVEIAFWKDPLRAESASIVVVTVIPLCGVLLLEWNAVEILFLLAWEFTAMSAMLWWLFDYPHRSTLMGITRAVFFSSIFSLLLWGVFAYGFGSTGYPVSLVENLSKTWPAAVAVALHASLLCHRRMEQARSQGVSFDSNDRIGVEWLLVVMLPVCAFLLLGLGGSILGWESINLWTLIGVILAKALVDIGYIWARHWRKREAHSVVRQ